MLKVLASTANEPEAQMLIGRLAGAGISAIAQRAIGGPEWGGSGARNIYVEERDFEQARELLAAAEQPISDEELARLSEEAGREHPPEGG